MRKTPDKPPGNGPGRAAPVKDHLGNSYPTQSAMCRAYGIQPSTLIHRLNMGYGLGRALTEPVRAKGRSSEMTKDHLGNEYPSKKAMCAAYGVTAATLNARLKAGLGLGQALTEPPRRRGRPRRKARDHLGNEYRSQRAMCDAYGISQSTFAGRRRAGHDIKQALTESSHRGQGKAVPITDHLGREYPTQRAMCEAWGIDPTAYCRSRRKGKTMREALEAPKKSPPEARTDHTGKEFPTVDAMCRAWDVKPGAYRNRIKEGMTKEQALTAGPKPHPNAVPATDHKGTTFPSTADMCRAWGIDMSTYRNRKKAGYPMKDILTMPKRSRNHPCKDHTGKQFGSVAAMCKAWGITVSAYDSRIAHGMDTETALTTPVGAPATAIPSTDHTGRTFPTMTAMATAWGIGPNTYKTRRKKGMSVEEALTTPVMGSPQHATPCTDHTGREFPTVKAMCEAWDVNPSTYKSRTQSGLTTGQALTGNRPPRPKRGRACTDHTGKEFPSVKAMCDAWNVRPATYRGRIKAGMATEQALTAPDGRTQGRHGPAAGAAASGRPRQCTDHTGRTFPTVQAMCDAWGVKPGTYRLRLRAGHAQEQALTMPDQRGRNLAGKNRDATAPSHAKPCTDHTGRTFPSVKAMCDAWGVAPGTYRSRTKAGLTQEQALAPPRAREQGNPKPCTDHTGKTFPTIRAMCGAWNVRPATYGRRLRDGLTQQQALTAPDRKKPRHPKKPKHPKGG